MKKSTKRRVAISLLVLLSVGAFSGFYLHSLQAEDVKNQTAFFTAFNACAKHMPEDKNYQMYLDPDNIPCYQQSLKAGHDRSLESVLASLFVKQGRYDEAQELYVDIAHPGIVSAWLHPNRTADARRMLQPGAMQSRRETMLQSDQASRDLLATTAKNEQEEQEFLRTHAVMSGVKIVHMSASDKAVWLQMRKQHSEEQKALQQKRGL